MAHVDSVWENGPGLPTGPPDARLHPGRGGRQQGYAWDPAMVSFWFLPATFALGADRLITAPCSCASIGEPMGFEPSVKCRISFLLEAFKYLGMYVNGDLSTLPLPCSPRLSTLCGQPRQGQHHHRERRAPLRHRLPSFLSLYFSPLGILIQVATQFQASCPSCLARPMQLHIKTEWD